MKKILLLPSLILFLMYFLSSCSIQKRVYRDGYQVEWNTAKNNSVKKNDAIKDNKIDSEIAKAEAATPAIASTEVPAQVSAPEKEASVKQPVEKKKKLIDRIIKEDTQEEVMKIQSGSKAAAFKSGFKTGLKMMMPDAEAHTLHLAIASFVLGIISLFAYYGAFVLGLLAVIFGLISIHRIRKGEGTYKGNTFAWIGLICGIIGIILATYIIQIM